MTMPYTVHRVAALAEETLAALADVLIDCVDGDASVGFMHPLSRERAVAFWRCVADGVAAGERVVLLAEDDGGPAAPSSSRPPR